MGPEVGVTAPSKWDQREKKVQAQPTVPLWIDGGTPTSLPKSFFRELGVPILSPRSQRVRQLDLETASHRKAIKSLLVTGAQTGTADEASSASAETRPWV